MAILSKLLSSAVVMAGACAHESVVQSKLSKPVLNLAQISKYADINLSLSKDDFSENNTAWTSDTIAKTAMDYTSSVESKQKSSNEQDTKAALKEVLRGSDDLKKALEMD